MLTGALEPALGGDPALVDAIGVNFYHDNQWEYPSGRKLGWHLIPRDRRWQPLHELLEEVFDRYRRPLCITETSHVGVGRAAWLREVSEEVSLAIDRGVPIIGVCLYPAIDRCGWDDASHWHNSGLWDVRVERDGKLERVLNRDYADELLRMQRDVLPGGVATPGYTAGRAHDVDGQRGFSKRCITMTNKNPTAENPLNDSANAIGERAASYVTEAKESIRDMARTASNTIDEGRGTAADRLEGAAAAVHERADQLPGGPKVEEFAHSAADRLSTTADYMRSHDAGA